MKTLLKNFAKNVSAEEAKQILEQDQSVTGGRLVEVHNLAVDVMVKINPEAEGLKHIKKFASKSKGFEKLIPLLKDVLNKANEIANGESKKDEKSLKEEKKTSVEPKVKKHTKQAAYRLLLALRDEVKCVHDNNTQVKTGMSAANTDNKEYVRDVLRVSWKGTRPPMVQVYSSCTEAEVYAVSVNGGDLAVMSKEDIMKAIMEQITKHQEAEKAAKEEKK